MKYCMYTGPELTLLCSSHMVADLCRWRREGSRSELESYCFQSKWRLYSWFRLHKATYILQQMSFLGVLIRMSRSISHFCWSKKQSIGRSAATLGEKSSSKRNIFTPVRDSSRLSCISWGRPQFKLWGALKLILGKKYHWQLDRFSFIALPGYLNSKPLILPAAKDMYLGEEMMMRKCVWFKRRSDLYLSHEADTRGPDGMVCVV